MAQTTTMTPPPAAPRAAMGDDEYTDAQLSDGRTLRFKGKLNPDQVGEKVKAFRAQEGKPQAAPAATPAPGPSSSDEEGFWHWFFGVGPKEEGSWSGSSGKGLAKAGFNKVRQIGKEEGQSRQDYRSSREFYDKVQSQYNSKLADIERGQPSVFGATKPYTDAQKATLKKQAKEERDRQLSADNPAAFIEQLAPNALGAAADIGESTITPKNAAIAGVAAAAPVTRPFIGAYFGITGLMDALKPRNDDQTDSDYETEADYVQRVLMGGAQAAGGAALAAAPHRTVAGERRYRLNKGTFAMGGGNPELDATLGDIDQTLREQKTKVKTVADVQDVVNATERRLNQHFETALFPLRGKAVVPTEISDALMTKANQPNLQMTPEGRRESAMYQKAAVNFQQEWTIEKLDLERRRLFDARIARKGSVEQSISRRASTATDIDQIIEDNIRELEYGELNRRYPGQKFEDLKFRQSQLVELKRQLQKRVGDLKNAQAKEKGAPMLSGEKATGSVSKHGLFGRVYAKIPGQGPETQANTAARKAFKRPGPGKALTPLGQPQNIPQTMTPPPIAARVPENIVSSAFGHDSVERFYDLKKQWSDVNNGLLKFVDQPDSPEAKAAINKMQDISQQINAMHVNQGVGTPGPIRDVVIVGAGPGGLAAATMAAADGLNVTFIDAQAEAGGQAKHSSRIENYPGFPAGIPGHTLAGQMYDQATRMGAEGMLGHRVTRLEHDTGSGLKTLTLQNGNKIQARSVIVAGGLEFRKMTFPGSDSPNIIYGDSQALTKAGSGKSVAVLGGSNGAAQAALGAATKAQHVTVISRSPIAKSMSDYQVQALHAHPNITVIEGDEIAGLQGNQLTTKNGQTLPADAVGIYAGSAPETSWLPEQVTKRNGRILVNSDLMTPVPGVFAIGDIREGAIGRIGFAVGDGQVATRNLFPYLQQSFPKPISMKPAETVKHPMFEADKFKKSQAASAGQAATVAGAATKREPEQ